MEATPVKSGLLQRVIMAAVEVKPPVTRNRTTAVVELAKEVALRVYPSGLIVTNANFVNNLNLGYTHKDVTRNALDIWSTKDWQLTAKGVEDGLSPELILASAVPSNSPKVDLFKNSSYDDNGQPVGDTVRFSTTFAKESLFPILKSVFAITEEVDFIDVYALFPTRDTNIFVSTNNFYYIPKPVVRGEKKGTLDVVKREGLFPFILVNKAMYEAEMADNFDAYMVITNPSEDAVLTVEKQEEQLVGPGNEAIAEADVLASGILVAEMPSNEALAIEQAEENFAEVEQ